MRRGGHLALSRQHGEKCLYFRRTHGAWMLHLPVSPVPADEKSHLVQINLLGAEAVVHVSDALAQLVQQAG